MNLNQRLLKREIERLYHKATRLYLKSMRYDRFRGSIIDKAFESELHKLLSK